MSLELAISRVDVADYVSALITVYVVVIIVRILMSWFRLPYNRWLAAFADFVSSVTDPYLRIFRRFLPLVRIGPGALDLSPIVGILVLTIVGGIVTSVIAG